MMMGWIFMTFLIISVVMGLYVYRLGLWLISSKKARIVYTSVYTFFILIFPLGRTVSRSFPDFYFNDLIVLTGSYLIILLLYCFMGALIADAVRMAVKLFLHYRKGFVCEQALRKILAVTVYIAAVVFIIIGHIHSENKHVTTVNLSSSQIEKPLRIVFVSDVHYGRILGKDYAEKFVAMINAQKPQLILIGGDLFDENLFSVRKNGIGESLKKLKADYGVFAVNGNHEFIGGVREADAYMREHGITVLQDDMVKAGPVYIAGREDLSVQRNSGKKREALADIMNHYYGKTPVIVLDHQPSALRESVSQKVFLQLSGHTHAGQFFPLNFIVPLIYEVSYGHAVIDSTNVYVSSGFGSWGPPVRIGSTPEIAVINIKPEK